LSEDAAENTAEPPSPSAQRESDRRPMP